MLVLSVKHAAVHGRQRQDGMLDGGLGMESLQNDPIPERGIDLW